MTSDFELPDIENLLHRLAVASWQYYHGVKSEFSDEEFDSLCRYVNKSWDSSDNTLNKFMNEKFSPDTGQWIHDYPYLYKVISELGVLYGE